MTQTSDEDRLLIHAYVDGELDPANARALEARIEENPALAAERDRIEELQSVLRTRFPIAAPPAGLRERIERAAGLRRAPVRPPGGVPARPGARDVGGDRRGGGAGADERQRPEVWRARPARRCHRRRHGG